MKKKLITILLGVSALAAGIACSGDTNTGKISEPQNCLVDVPEITEPVEVASNHPNIEWQTSISGGHNSFTHTFTGFTDDDRITVRYYIENPACFSLGAMRFVVLNSERSTAKIPAVMWFRGIGYPFTLTQDSFGEDYGYRTEALPEIHAIFDASQSRRFTTNIEYADGSYAGATWTN